MYRHTEKTNEISSFRLVTDIWRWKHGSKRLSKQQIFEREQLQSYKTQIKI